MDKIYLVTMGEYSDYRILAAFSTHDLAEKFVEIKNNLSHIEIEEYLLDKFADTVRKGLSPWETWIMKDGSIFELSGENPSQIPEFEEGTEFKKGEIWYRKDLRHGYLKVKSYARDEQHSRKIAMEKWAEFIALGNWEEEEESTTPG